VKVVKEDVTLISPIRSLSIANWMLFLISAVAIACFLFRRANLFLIRVLFSLRSSTDIFALQVALRLIAPFDK